jgi:adapter protein MecA 1/2
MAIDPTSIDSSRHNALIALLAEFGEATSVTEAVLEEYGKLIMNEGAVRQLCQYFSF